MVPDKRIDEILLTPTELWMLEKDVRSLAFEVKRDRKFIREMLLDEACRTTGLFSSRPSENKEE
jgi:hypothetical protein